MKLSITIPAYNEEGAIQSIIERCLAIQPRLLAETDLTAIEIIVVSDGSTDRTVEIAQRCADQGQIRLIAYVPNAGYGAALKRGFRESTGELVSFLDADGTCDPAHFIHLVNACLREGADIACGCRMTPTSKMPPIRRLGNRIFRTIINTIAETHIRDSASGMRVIRRDALARIYPLPDGLHFTPAMSCRAALDSSLKMAEVDMHYEERIGESKLRVVQDGIRFLNVILDIALTYRPLRFYGGAALVFLALAGVLGLSIAYAKFIEPGYAHLPTWYLFRMVTALAAASIGFTLLMIGLVAERVAVMVQRHQPPGGVIHSVILKAIGSKSLFAVGLGFAFAAVLLNLSSLSDWLTTGAVLFEMWWAYVVTGAFLLLSGAQLMAAALLDKILLLLGARRTYLEESLARDISNVPPEAAPDRALALSLEAAKTPGSARA